MNRYKKYAIYLYYIIMLTSFGFELTMMAEMVDAIEGNLASIQHILFSFLLGFGFLLFGLTRKLIKQSQGRQILMFSVNVVYILMMVSTFMDIIAFRSIYWILILMIGYLGGAVYYIVMVKMHQIQRGILIMSIGIALPYFLQVCLQPIINSRLAYTVVFILLFILISVLLIKPPEWVIEDMLPYSSEKEDYSIPTGNRLRRLIGTSVMMIVSIGIVEMSWSDDSVVITQFYEIPRIGIVIAMLSVGFVADKFGWKYVERLVILSQVFVFAAVYGSQFAEFRLFLFNFCAGIYNAYLILGFWTLAPSTKNPDLWASGGRIVAMIETVYFYIVQDVSVTGNYFLILIQAFAVALLIGILMTQMQEIYPVSSEENDFDSFCNNYHFTPRERDVMMAILESDEKAKAICVDLGFSERMFYRYIKQMSEKTGAKNRNALVNLYREFSKIR